jgi:hypothetical protein
LRKRGTVAAGAQRSFGMANKGRLMFIKTVMHIVDKGMVDREMVDRCIVMVVKSEADGRAGSRKEE